MPIEISRNGQSFNIEGLEPAQFEALYEFLNDENVLPAHQLDSEYYIVRQSLVNDVQESMRLEYAESIAHEYTEVPD